MSDTYNYNSGSPMGGMGSFFGGCGLNGCNSIMDLLALVVVGGLFGFGGWGGWGGGYGGRGVGGQIGADAVAATTAALVGQQQVADRVAGIATGVDAVNGIATANGVKLEGVKDAVINGSFANQTNLCELGNNIAQQFNAATLQDINNHNNLTNQITDLRFQLGQCCCQTQQKIADLDCKLSNQIQGAKSEIIGYMQSQRMAELEAKNLELKGQISQANQTQQIIAAMNSGKCCQPCAPCNPCGNVWCSVQNAFADEIAQRIINPTTTTTTA